MGLAAAPPWPEVVLFDFFDTLTRWTRAPRDVITEVLADHGTTVRPHHVFEQAMALARTFPRHDEFPQEGEWQYWRHHDPSLLSRLGVEPDGDVLADLRAAFEKQVRLEALPGAHDVVRAVTEGGVRVAVLTNATYGMLRDADRLGFTPLFETIFLSQRMGVGKPDPRIFNEAMGALRVDASHTWMVGDNPAHDVAGARAAGVFPVLVGKHARSAEDGVAALEHLSGLTGLLASSRAGAAGGGGPGYGRD